MNTDPPPSSLAGQEQRQIEWAHLPRRVRYWKKAKVLVVGMVWGLLSFAAAMIGAGMTEIHPTIMLLLWAVSIMLVARTYARHLGMPYSIF